MLNNKLNTAIKLCEEIIISLGGKFVLQRKDKETWGDGEGDFISKLVTKNVYRYREEYVCVDILYFQEKPFLVLEFADEVEGFYEDGDPFPYDLSIEDMKVEIECELGIREYPKVRGEERTTDREMSEFLRPSNKQSQDNRMYEMMKKYQANFGTDVTTEMSSFTEE